VVLVGYGVDEATGLKYWLVRNSWSPNWGENGYGKFLRSDDDESNCAIDTTPQDGSACAGDDEPITVCGTSGLLYDSSYPLNADLK
jgi:cathepsin L